MQLGVTLTGGDTPGLSMSSVDQIQTVGVSVGVI